MSGVSGAASDSPTAACGAPAQRYECRICWNVYDPAQGDAVWQVPVGTAFADLPAHWSCPGCAAMQDQFLPVRDD